VLSGRSLCVGLILVRIPTKCGVSKCDREATQGDAMTRGIASKRQKKK
jgi:hypothetical protein